MAKSATSEQGALMLQSLHDDNIDRSRAQQADPGSEVLRVADQSGSCLSLTVFGKVKDEPDFVILRLSDHWRVETYYPFESEDLHTIGIKCPSG